MLLAFLLACARLEGPSVYPKETPVPDETTAEPTTVPTGRRDGSAVATRAPANTAAPAPGLSQPTSARGDIASVATSTVGSALASGSIRSAPPHGLETAGTLHESGVQPVRMKAVWVSTVLNIDFPAAIADETAQKQELVTILENVKKWGMDTVMFQVRPMGDALYKSSLNPWSHFLTGSAGTDPGWDPLDFLLQEAHGRGIAVHAWLNPYRVIHPSVGWSVSDLPSGSFAAAHPQWLIQAGGGWYYDPAVPEVREHIAETVSEIIRNYDIDGIHFDDYFYPSEYELPAGADPDGLLGRERRENVNAMIRLVYQTIKSYNENIIFGISPFGIWKNAQSDPQGSDTQGSESYYLQAADTLTWVREKIVDYVAPQLYWPIGFEAADYRVLTAWWSEKMAGSGVSLIIGQGIYREEIAGEIAEELKINAAHPEITGSIFFSYTNLAENPACAAAVAAWYDR